MLLKLKILSYDDQPPAFDQTASVEESGGAIGRSSGSDLCLTDSERIVSSTHAQISFQDGHFQITDVSTNGTFVNASETPLGNGNTVVVAHGDRFKIGRYVVEAEIERGPADGSGLPAGPQIVPSGPVSPGAPLSFGTDLGGGNERSIDDFLDANPVHGASPLSDEPMSGATDPLDPLAGPPDPVNSGGLMSSGAQLIPSDFNDDAPASPDRPIGGGIPQSDAAPLLSAAFQAPRMVPEAMPDAGRELIPTDAAKPAPNVGAGGIPTDWDVTEGGDPTPAEPEPEPIVPPIIGPDILAPEPPAQAVIPPAPAPAPARTEEIPPRPDPGPRTPAPQPAGPVVDDGLIAAIMDAAGLAGLDLDNATPESIATNLGQILREAVDGIVQALRDRTDFKGEFRLDLTRIQPMENNPLKFSTTTEDVVAQMLTGNRPGLKPPGEAFREAFDDLRVHQLAMMVGLKACLNTLMARVNPAAIEELQSKRKSLVLTSRGAMCWELYAEQYDELAKDAADGFRRLLAEEFANAYDEQVANLRRARFGKET